MLNICEGIKGARHPQLVFETSECPMCLETADKMEAQQALREANTAIQELDARIEDFEAQDRCREILTQATERMARINADRASLGLGRI
jgi:hypothetical protein